MVINTIPKFVLSKDGKLKGEIRGRRRCRLSGCTGRAFIVRWPDGKYTYPCSKGVTDTGQPGTVQIE